MNAMQILFALIAIQQIYGWCRPTGYKIKDWQGRYLKKSGNKDYETFKTRNPINDWGDDDTIHHFIKTTIGKDDEGYDPDEAKSEGTCFYKCDVELTTESSFFLKASEPLRGRGIFEYMSTYGGTDFLSMNGGKYGFKNNYSVKKIENPYDDWWVATTRWRELDGWTNDRVHQYDVEYYTGNKEHTGWKILQFEYSFNRHRLETGSYYWGYKERDGENTLFSQFWHYNTWNGDDINWVNTARWFYFETC